MNPAAAVLWIFTTAFVVIILHTLMSFGGMPQTYSIGIAFGIGAAVYHATGSYFEAMFKAAKSAGSRDGIDTFRAQVQQWRINVNLLTTIHYTLGVMGILSSSLAAAKPAILIANTGVAETVAWIAAACTALITFFSAEKKAAKYSEAVFKLQTQIDRYDIDATYTFNDVASSRDECLKLLKQK
jgi:hypothetical protein